MRSDPALSQTPFIMVTAESKTENVIAAKKAGVSNYIVKPFNAQTLQSKIEAVFKDPTKPPRPKRRRRRFSEYRHMLFLIPPRLRGEVASTCEPGGAMLDGKSPHSGRAFHARPPSFRGGDKQSSPSGFRPGRYIGGVEDV